MKFNRFKNKMTESYSPDYDIALDNMDGSLRELKESIYEGEIDEHSVTHAFELAYFTLQLIGKMEKNAPSIKTLYRIDIKQLKDMINKL